LLYPRNSGETKGGSSALQHAAHCPSGLRPKFNAFNPDQVSQIDFLAQLALVSPRLHLPRAIHIDRTPLVIAVTPHATVIQNLLMQPVLRGASCPKSPTPLIFPLERSTSTHFFFLALAHALPRFVRLKFGKRQSINVCILNHMRGCLLSPTPSRFPPHTLLPLASPNTSPNPHKGELRTKRTN
jgi:hypothetical protein